MSSTLDPAVTRGFDTIALHGGHDGEIASGVSEDLIRLSVGIESIDDILADLAQALDGAA